MPQNPAAQPRAAAIHSIQQIRLFLLAGRHTARSAGAFFFFDFVDFAVDLVARRFGKGIEKFLEAFGLAEFTGEGGMAGN